MPAQGGIWLAIGDGRRTDPERARRPPCADQAAIATTLGALLTGFTERNADALSPVYSDDADWVNAFGTTKKGGTEIVEYLRGSSPTPTSTRASWPRRREHRAAAHRRRHHRVTHLRVEGQGLVGGGEIAVRDNHSLRIVQRQPDGRWLIVSEMYMDARTDATYRTS